MQRHVSIDCVVPLLLQIFRKLTSKNLTILTVRSRASVSRTSVFFFVVGLAYSKV